jgi:hypothetical protein
LHASCVSYRKTSRFLYRHSLTRYQFRNSLDAKIAQKEKRKTATTVNRKQKLKISRGRIVSVILTSCSYESSGICPDPKTAHYSATEQRKKHKRNAEQHTRLNTGNTISKREINQITAIEMNDHNKRMIGNKLEKHMSYNTADPILQRANTEKASNS